MKKREEFEKSIKEESSKKSVENKKQKDEREKLFEGRKKWEDYILHLIKYTLFQTQN